MAYQDAKNALGRSQDLAKRVRELEVRCTALEAQVKLLMAER